MAAVFVVFIASIHAYAASEKKIFGQISLAIAVVYATIIMIDYVQWAVLVPVSTQERLPASRCSGSIILTEYSLFWKVWDT